jgi:hypothetical protein
MNGPEKAAKTPWGRAESLLIAVCLLLGLCLRLLDLRAPFDRQFDGFQGSFFAVCAINYERLGFEALAGYPIANIDPRPGEPQTYYAYANHPPLVPWMGWASLRLFGPAGWSEAWREQRAPQGIEGTLRAPFLLGQLLGWAGLSLALASLGARRAALFTAALYGLMPLTCLYAGLVNYENPSLGALCLAAAAFARRRSGGGWPWLALGLGLAALAAGTTFAPVFFLPGLCLWTWLGRGRRGFIEGSALALAMAVPMALHGHFARRALALVEAEPSGLAERARLLLAPLLDGSLPFGRWLALQGRILLEYLGPGHLALAAAGLLLALRGLSRPGPVRAAHGLALALLSGGLLVQLGFYRHTGDPQEPFLLNLAPALAALGGLALASLAERSRGAPSLALLAPGGLLLAAALGFPNGLALHRVWRGGGAPLPEQIGAELATLLPSGAVGWYPEGLGFNNAVFFYAWRTLLPVGPATYSLALEQQQRFGLEHAPLYLLLPKQPLGAAVASTAAVAADLETKRPGQLASPDAESANYRAYRISR